MATGDSDPRQSSRQRDSSGEDHSVSLAAAYAVWFAHLLGAFAAGALLIPFFRIYPRFVHQFAAQLRWWQRDLLLIVLSMFAALAFLRLFRPCLEHLAIPTLLTCLRGWCARVVRNLPVWTAWAIAFVVLWIADSVFGLGPHGYSPQWYEWLLCVIGILLAIVLYWRPWQSCALTHGSTATGSQNDELSKPTIGDRETDNSTTTNPRGAPDQPPNWEQVENWLPCDEPAKDDLFGDRHCVAERLASLLTDGAQSMHRKTTQSIGIVGPFGSGKTTIVKWVIQSAQRGWQGKSNVPLFIFSEHSCWGFESSADCIYQLLGNAIDRVNRYADTFAVTGLPRSYRLALFAGRDWLSALCEPFIGSSNWKQQFRRLSDLLRRINAHLVLVVEDLDRCDSPRFNIADVTGFLQELRQFDNLFFLLTAAPSATDRIDFPRLCDHIELIRPLEREQVGQVVGIVRQQCLDPEQFPQHAAARPREDPWDQNGFADAVRLRIERHALAALLSQPRVLRHVLWRTFSAWQSLAGEIDWDSLLALNALRVAAPEAFSFLLRNWHYLHQDWQRDGDPSQSDKDRQGEVRKDWDVTQQQGRTAGSSRWEPRDVRLLIDFILPSAPTWLDDNGQRANRAKTEQGLWEERYWYRAINEIVGPDEVRDQEVLRDLQNWMDNKDKKLIERLSQSDCYVKVFQKWAPCVLSKQLDLLRRLIEEMLRKIGTLATAWEDATISRFLRICGTLAELGCDMTGNVTQRQDALGQTRQAVGQVLGSAAESGDPVAAIALCHVVLDPNDSARVDTDRLKSCFGAKPLSGIEKVKKLLPHMPERWKEEVGRILKQVESASSGPQDEPTSQ